MMPLRHSVVASLVVILLGAVAAGCDKKAEKADDKKEEKKSDDKAVASEVDYEARAKNFGSSVRAEEVAQLDREKARAQLIEEVAVSSQSDKAGQNIERACQEVARAADEFMSRFYAGEATLTRWNEGKQAQLALLEELCRKQDSMDIASCQINGLSTQRDELRDDLPGILTHCINRYGAD